MGIQLIQRAKNLARMNGYERGYVDLRFALRTPRR
jgi:hypothetical protein